MSAHRVGESKDELWTPIPDSPEKFSTGTADLDRLVGGGLQRGSMALFRLDETVGTADRELLFTPLLLNFLHHSNGVMAVLPARETPHAFRTHLTRWVGRRRFDTRVRVVDYVGEDSGTPYVVNLRVSAPGTGSAKKDKESREKDLQKMAAAEMAVRGARSKVFVEMIAFEILEMIAGPEVATRMFLHGIKRSRAVGNLCLGLLRSGLATEDALGAMADAEFSLHHNELGLLVKGIRPSFPSHLVVVETKRGTPYVSLLPNP